MDALKVIEYARDVWRAAIITLASGYNVPHREMIRQINECFTHEIPIFAAAGNKAKAGSIKFPANLDSLIYMFATDANGKVITSSLKPSPNKKDFYNFAIFGENMVCRPREKSKSGMSMSTFIGAAVAGLLLDICQRPDVKRIRA